MTVQELIESLSDLVAQNPEIGEQQVFASYSYGDHGRTEALVTCRSVGMRHVRESCYSSTGFAIPRELPGWGEADDDTDERYQKKFVLGMDDRYDDDDAIYSTVVGQEVWK